MLLDFNLLDFSQQPLIEAIKYERVFQHRLLCNQSKKSQLKQNFKSRQKLLTLQSQSHRKKK